jgi:hypothetical protein
MTSTQFLLLIGTIYIAPHVPAFGGIPLGLFFVIYASCIGLGLI